MQNRLISLIFLMFIGVTAGFAWAQNDASSKSTQGLQNSTRMLPLEQWEERRLEQHQSLFRRLNTYPMIHKESFQLDIGLGQFLFRIPI